MLIETGGERKQENPIDTGSDGQQQVLKLIYRIIVLSIN